MPNPPPAVDLPHSLEAERSVIGSVLINPDIFLEISYKLKAEDFFIHRHKFIWDSFERLHQKGTTIDMVTVTEELDRFGNLNEIGGPAYLTSLLNEVPSSLNAENYADIVVGQSLRRQAIEWANRIATSAYNESNNTEDVISEMSKASTSIAELSSGERLKGARQVASEEFDRLYEAAESKELPGVPTGFYDLDHLLNNMRAGDMDIIAGRPGMGKTAFMQSIVRHVCNHSEHPRKVLVAQFADMDTGGWAERMVSMESQIPLERIRSGRLEDDESSIYVHAIEVIGSWNFMIDDTPHMSIDRLFSVSRRAQSVMKGLDLIVVDYLQQAGVPKDVRKYGNRVAEVGYISSNLKRLARELKIPVLAAAQLSRAVEQRQDKRPVLSDLRESGDIENDADVIMFIYRDEVYDPKEENKNNAEIIVAKHRNGPTGTIELVWRPELTRLDNKARF